MRQSGEKLLIAGGGTGGHILAGIAVADAWPSSSILFVGTKGKIEERLVPQNGYSLELLKIGALNQVSRAQRLKTFVQLPMAFLKSIAVLLKFKPEYILGVGGYSSGPVLLMGWLLKKLGLLSAKIAILEQNSVPGFTNKVLSRFVDSVFVAFSGAERAFQGCQTMITGNPVRSSMKPLESAPIDPFAVFIFGGSQGALGINSLVLDSLSHLAKIPQLVEKLEIIHQTGVKDFERVRAGYQGFPFRVKVEKFIDDMPSVYAKSSLLICRSGASTLAEIAAVKRAAILIPLPTAADNHQEKNARLFTDAGAGILLSQKTARGEDLAHLIYRLYSHPGQLRELENQVGNFYRPSAASEVVEALRVRQKSPK